MMQPKGPQPTTPEGLPPLSDAAHWWRVVDEGRLGSHNPGALLALYDAKDPATDKRLEGIVLTHILVVARRLASRFMPSDTRSRYDAIRDVVGLVGVAIADPAKVSVRQFFTTFIRYRCLDVYSENNEEEPEGGASNLASHPDPEGETIHALDLKTMMSQILEPARREALQMLLDGWSQKDIARRLRRHRTTVAGWIANTDVEFVKELRSR